tara:strand:- start:912 stop:1463 length:552 start_codon:yes stop_codon:yes gene_type:complete
MVNFKSYINNTLKKRRTPRKLEKFKHSAIIFKGNIKRSVNILSTGLNHYKTNIRLPSIHAEMHAGNCLPFSRRIQKVNLFVGRPNGGMSKPCSQCIKYLDNLCNKGYRVTNIFYTIGDHNILKTTLNKLKNDEQQHISSFYRHSKNITCDDCNDCDNSDHNHDHYEEYEDEDEDEDGLADKRR